MRLAENQLGGLISRKTRYLGLLDRNKARSDLQKPLFDA